LLVVTFILLANSLTYSQDKGIQLPEGNGFFIYEVPDKQRIIDRLQRLEKYSTDKLTINSKWTYHLTVSSCRLYLNKDSSLYHFNEAYKIKPKATCSSMRVRHNTFIKALEKEKKEGIVDPYVEVIRTETGNNEFSWYLWDLPNFDEFAFIESCNQDYPIINNNVKRENTEISEIIKNRDQKKRNNLKEQQILDQVNRDYIDSLFLIKESLNEFIEEEIYQISMVTHHSEDCDWVYKWTERLIDHYEKGYKGKTVLGPLLKRMFNEYDGYCSKQDLQKRDYFIYMIKYKYPKFVENNKIKW